MSAFARGVSSVADSLPLPRNVRYLFLSHSMFLWYELLSACSMAGLRLVFQRLSVAPHSWTSTLHPNRIVDLLFKSVLSVVE